jgi:NitT/TauT family transport system permease protein
VTATRSRLVPTRRGGQPRRPSGGARRRSRLGRITRIVAANLTLLGLWWLASRVYAAYVLPGPPDVWNSFTAAAGRGLWGQEVAATLTHLFAAVALIIVIGLPVGIIIGRFVIADDLSRGILVLLQTVPTIVLIAVALVFIGTTDSSVITVAMASGLTYFMLNIIQGSRSIDHTLIEMAKAYGASERTIMRAIILPSTVPYFLAGCRIALGVTWQVTLFSEYLMGTGGIGFQISTDIKLLDTSDVFMWGLTAVLFTLLFEYMVFRPGERYLTRHVKKAE